MYGHFIIPNKVRYPEKKYFPVKATICPNWTIIFQQDDKNGKYIP
jgi:hypothetical protein